MKNKILAIGMCVLMILVIFSNGFADGVSASDVGFQKNSIEIKYSDNPREWKDSDGDGISDDEDIYDSGNGGIKVCITYYKADGSSDHEGGVPDPYFKIWVDIDGDYQIDPGESKTSSVYTDQEEICYPLSFTVDIDDDVSAIYIQINAYDKGSYFDEMIDLSSSPTWNAAYLWYYPIDNLYSFVTNNGSLDLIDDEMDGYIEFSAQVVEISTGYAIITANSIVSNSANLDSYINHLQSRGFITYLVTEDDYGSAVGQDRAVNIRNWLKNNYQDKNIKYVLLVGNPDPDDTFDPTDTYGDIPMMMCWSNGNDYDPVPTDYFFADLTGDWDSDGDNYYGEYDDDNVNFTADVYVGRIPFYGDYDDLDSILNKTIYYNGIKQNILLPMAICFYEKEYNEYTERNDGRDIPKYVIEDTCIPNGWGHHVMYERSGLDPVPTSAPYYDEPINKTNVINAWNSGDYGIVFWSGHGSYDGALRKYWASDDNSDGLPSPDEMIWESFMSSLYTDTLLDTNVFTYQCSCLNGYPEYSDNLQYSLLKNGAICTVAATRPAGFSWTTYPWVPKGDNDCREIGYKYVKNLVNNKESTGESLYNAKFNPGEDECWRNLMHFNIYGDPSLTVTNVSNREPTLSNHLPDKSFDEDHSLAAFNLNDYFFDPDGESINYTVSGNHNIMVVINPDGTVVFSALENWYGNEIITFKATDPWGAFFKDAITVTVNPINDAPMIITTLPNFDKNEDDPNWIVDLTLIKSDVDNTPSELVWSVSNWNTSLFDSITVIDNNITFDLKANAYGNDEVTITLSDGLLTDSQNIWVNVTPINDPPVIAGLTDQPLVEDVIFWYDITPYISDVDNDISDLVVSTNSSYIIVHNNNHTLEMTYPNGVTIDYVGVTVSDGILSDYEGFVFTIMPVNDAPVVNSITANQTSVSTEGTVTITVDASDEDDDDLTYHYSCTGGTISGTSSTVTWTAPNAVGNYTITAYVNDGKVNSGSKSVNVTVTVLSEIENHAPVVNTITASSTAVKTGETVTITVVATDEDDGNLNLTYHYSCTGGSISGTGSSVTWTAPSTAGDYTITVYVNDGKVNSNSKSVSVTVTSPEKEKPKGFIPGFEATILITMIGACVMLLRRKRNR